MPLIKRKHRGIALIPKSLLVINRSNHLQTNGLNGYEFESKSAGLRCLITIKVEYTFGYIFCKLNRLATFIPKQKIRRDNREFMICDELEEDGG